MPLLLRVVCCFRYYLGVLCGRGDGFGNGPASVVRFTMFCVFGIDAGVGAILVHWFAVAFVEMLSNMGCY